MPKTIYEDELECECGGAMKPKLFNVEGFAVRGVAMRKMRQDRLFG